MPLGSILDEGTVETSLECLSLKYVFDESIATTLIYEPHYAASVGSHSSSVKSERNGSTDRRSTPQSPWTSNEDELLLYLRNVAQLNWRTILTYFPGVTLGTVKSRYKHIGRFRVTWKGVGDGPKCRVQSRRPTIFRGIPPPLEQGKKFRAPSTAKSRRQTLSKAAEYKGILHRRPAAKRGKNAEDVTSLATATLEDAHRQTLRSGLPIPHPSGHRPSEGYMKGYSGFCHRFCC